MLSDRANATSVIPVCSATRSAIVVGAEIATRMGIRIITAFCTISKLQRLVITANPASGSILTILQATYQLVERVVAPDVFAHQGDLAGRGGPCGGMNRAGLRVCRLPSRKRVERPVNCANVYCDACPDPRERTS